MGNLWVRWPCDNVAKWGVADIASRFQGFPVWMWVSRGWWHWSAHVCMLWDFAWYTVCMHACVCVIVHTWCIVLQTTASNLTQSCSFSHWDPHTFSPRGLSCSSVHSYEQQHLAERDICSVRECPNYSWLFNHSGFALCGICGVSHKCVTATLVNGSFMIVVLHCAPPN